MVQPCEGGADMRRILCTIALIVIEIALILICIEGCYGWWFTVFTIIFGLLIIGAWQRDFAHKMLFVCLFIPFILPFWWIFRKPPKKKEKVVREEYWIFW